MTLTLVDSNILVDAIRARAPALRFLEEAARAGPIWSSVVVRAELIIGAMPDEQGRVGAWLNEIEWQDVTVPIADLAGRLGMPFRRSHSIGMVDLIVAATAIELGGTLATLNVRDFPMFPGLQPPY